MIVKPMWPLVPGCSDITSGAELQSQFWREPSVGQQQAVARHQTQHRFLHPAWGPLASDNTAGHIFTLILTAVQAESGLLIQIVLRQELF